jgi:N-acetyl-gamma-glutamyl-phosphate/LysW-gamma-L-alpha-aminoadipyl-6-phosphate reductase
VKGPMRVGIVGGSGFVGGELLRILLRHPGVEVSCATSRKYAEQYIYRVHANLRGFTDLQFSEQNLEEVIDKSDLVFTAVPHGSAARIMPRLVESGVKIVDMSADFRLRDPKQYPIYYEYEHPHPELLDKFVYGVPEIRRDEIKNSPYVSSPGCMAITSILALAPLAKLNLFDNDHIVVDAKIGSSGGGAEPSKATHHAERYGVIRPYKPVGHRHTAEVEQEIGLLSGSAVKVSFSAHAVNIVRGILCTAYVFQKRQVTIQEIWKIYRSLYGAEPFIRLVRDKQGIYRFPDPKVVVGSNFCDIGFELDERVGRIILMAATDNMIKGAAGNGVQCMNLMTGADEKAGLDVAPIHPM